MNSTWKLISSDSSEEYDNNSPVWISEKGNLLQLSHSLIFSPELINHEIQGMWRYEKMIPVSYESKVSFNEGMTPIVKEKISGKSLQFKLEYLFPTGSYKDRGASVLVSKIKELGISHIVEDSSGNAGVAIATYATKAGIKSEIYVSQSASQTKLKQLKNVGANIVSISGSREDVAYAAKERAKEIYYASHAINPYFFQGTKTFAYEIWEQTQGKLPERIFFPTGNGTLLIGAFIGFNELLNAGCISVMPQLIAVQAQHCPSLVSEDISAFKPTIAEGIAVKNPIRKKEIIHSILQSKGEVITVTEEEILNALQILSYQGYDVEKTSAVALAGWLKAESPSNSLLPLTGHGLKNP